MENFDQPENEQEIIPTKSAEALLSSLPNRSGNKILEIGLDEQGDSIFFAKENNEVLVVDSRNNLIEKVREKANELGVSDKMKFQILENFRGNLKLDSEENQFDGAHSIVFLNGTILDKSIEEIARVLRPGGKAVIFIYESTLDENGQERRFFRENTIEDAASKTNLKIDEKNDFLDPRHENKTRVNIYYLTKQG